MRWAPKVWSTGILFFSVSLQAMEGWGSGTAQIAKAGAIDHAVSIFQGYSNPGFVSKEHLIFSVCPLWHQWVEPATETNKDDSGAGVQFSGMVPFEIGGYGVVFQLTGMVPLGNILQSHISQKRQIWHAWQDARPALHPSLSFAWIPHRFGIGVGVAITMQMVSSIRMDMDPNASQFAPMMDTQVAWQGVPFGGVYAQPLLGWHVSIAVHGAEVWHANITGDVQWKLGDSGHVAITGEGKGALFFLPFRVRMASTWEVISDLYVSAEVGWQAWSSQMSHRMSFQGMGMTHEHDLKLSDIWVPRLGITWDGTVRVHCGAAYVPAVAKDRLSPFLMERWVGGMGVEIPKISFLGGRWTVGIFGQVHVLHLGGVLAYVLGVQLMWET